MSQSSARIAPAAAPFTPAAQARLDRMTPPGRAPLVLFTTLARDERLMERFFAGGLLDRGHLTLRQREIVIDRTTALCRAEYEWGVHIAAFGERAGLSEAQILSLVDGGADDDCWSASETLLLKLCDELHQTSSLSDTLWSALSADFSDAAMIELIMLAGFYHTVSYLTNALRLPLETDAPRFPRVA